MIEIDLKLEQQNILIALLNDNKTLIKEIYKKLLIFAKRVFEDSNNQFNI